MKNKRNVEDNYLEKIIEQYQASQGIKNVDVDSEYFIDGLAGWVLSNQHVGEIYVDFLMRLGFFVVENGYLEIGKGCHDTIISEDFNSNILTRYNFSFLNSPIYSKVLKGSLCVDGNRLMTITEEPLRRAFKCYRLDFINTVMTHNVYSVDELDTIIDVNNAGKKVILGAYGLIEDKNRIDKIESLRAIKSKLTGLVDEKYAYIGDNYVYCLYSKDKYPRGNNKRAFTR